MTGGFVTLHPLATADRSVDGRPDPALKGLNNSARGNAPGLGSARQFQALKGRHKKRGASRDRSRRHRISLFGPSRALIRDRSRYPGRKPWAVILSPFRAANTTAEDLRRCNRLKRYVDSCGTEEGQRVFCRKLPPLGECRHSANAATRRMPSRGECRPHAGLVPPSGVRSVRRGRTG